MLKTYFKINIENITWATLSTIQQSFCLIKHTKITVNSHAAWSNEKSPTVSTPRYSLLLYYQGIHVGYYKVHENTFNFLLWWLNSKCILYGCTSTKYKFYNNNHTYRWFMFRISAWVFKISLQKLCVIKRQFSVSFPLSYYIIWIKKYSETILKDLHVHVLNFLGFTCGCNEVAT